MLHKGSNIFPSLIDSVLETNLLFSYSFSCQLPLVEILPLLYVECYFLICLFCFAFNVHVARFKNLTLHPETSGNCGPSSASANLTEIRERCLPKGECRGKQGGCTALPFSLMQQSTLTTLDKGLVPEHPCPPLLIYAFPHHA